MRTPAHRDAAFEAYQGRHAGGGQIPVMPRSSVTQNALLVSTRLKILLSNSVKLPKLLYYLHS